MTMGISVYSPRGSSPTPGATYPSSWSNGPPRMSQKPAGPAYTLRRVMPSEWSWYQSVLAGWSLRYLKVAVPGDQSSAYLALK